MNFYKRAIVKFGVITLFAAVLLSLFIFYLYNLQSRKEDTGILGLEENKILSFYGRSEEELSLCSYPEANSGSQIAWTENESYSGEKSLRLTFKHNRTRHYLGIHFPLTLNFKPWLEKGILEFQIKGGENFSSVTNLDVYIKESSIIHKMVRVSQPVMLNEQWQRLSLLLSEFSLVKEEEVNVKEEGFSWEIQEILFSVNTSISDETTELFIDDLRIISDDKVIYDLF